VEGLPLYSADGAMGKNRIHKQSESSRRFARKVEEKMELEEKGKITEMNKMDTYIGGKEEEEIVILLRYVIFSRETSFPCGDGFKIRKKLLHFLLFFR
jgi:hypothetical protein